MSILRSNARSLLVLVFLVTLAAAVPSPVHARVARIEILERKPFANAMEFGDVGPYEYIRGRLHYAVSPENVHNRAVVDLQLASRGRLREDLTEIVDGRIVTTLGEDPRNPSGEVEFSGDFILLKPVDLQRGNHRLLYDVNNRGNLRMLSYYNNAVAGNRPTDVEHAGNGWLMRQGYSLLWSAWNWDVESVGRQPLRIDLPIVLGEQGDPLLGQVHAELAVQSRDGVVVERIAWGGSRCYPAAKQYVGRALLTVREGTQGDRETIPRDQWQFATLSNDGKPHFDPVHVHLPAGFEKGKLYELRYVAMHPRVVGLGLAAVRDAISFFKFESGDDAGTANPLAVSGIPDPAYAYTFGISQSGRFITHMIYQGFHVDEKGRLTFDGARPHVAGAGKGSFNYRFAQTTHHQKHLQGHFFPADHFPFHFTPDGITQHDPLGQPGRKQGDVLSVAKRLNQIPKIMIVNHGGEYWTRSASLIHTSVDGNRDAKLHPSVRVYMINGVRHGTPSRAARRSSPTSQHAMNQLDPRPIGRALLVALDQWVSNDVEPPPSQVPRVERDELVTAEAHQAAFPDIPSYGNEYISFPPARHPGTNLRPSRIDFGPRFWSEGIQDYAPPKLYGPDFATLVPQIDADGNPLGGIRLPRLVVPLGTNQAFNPRHESTGAPSYLRAFESSFWPFALTRDQARANGDQRPSIEERYPDKDDFVAKVAAAARSLTDQRLLLEEDRAKIVQQANSLAWPPQPLDRWPFWVTESAQ